MARVGQDAAAPGGTDADVFLPVVCAWGSSFLRTVWIPYIYSGPVSIVFYGEVLNVFQNHSRSGS